MTYRFLACAGLLAFAGSALAAPTEKPGTYKEAVLCSGLTAAVGTYLDEEAQRTGNSGSKDNAIYIFSLNKRWVAQAIATAPEVATTMDDVGTQSKRFTAMFNKSKATDDFQMLLGDDLNQCLEAGKALPEN